jgi:hypothetical protein
MFMAVAGPAQASDLLADLNGCSAAIRAAERASRLPTGLLGSIAVVESGRPDPRTGRVAPWPWTINVGGTGSYFQNKQEAIAAVEAARARGVQSVDVGCMQVNLMHHPNAFASLDQAFDPQANAAYAAGFLTRLFEAAGSWPEAAASYHSATPGLREDYQRRVFAGWAEGKRYGGLLATAALKPAIDPLNHYTPAFRAQLMEAASDHAKWAALGIVPHSPRIASNAVSGTMRNAVAGRRSRVRLASLARSGPAGD